MPKGYWIAFYHSISDTEALSRYGARAPSVIAAGGGRILARGVAARAYEAGDAGRTVLIEFDSVEAAIAVYESDAYREVRSLLDGAIEREIRIVEGI
jgi:uncharacterized protein (DUF1330 family)